MFKHVNQPLLLSFFILLLLQCVHLKQAKEAYQASDYQKTLQLCKQAIQKDSTDSQAHLLLIKCHRQLSEPDTVYTLLLNHHHTILKDPDTRSDLIDLYLYAGQQLYKKPNLRHAYNAIKQAEALNPQTAAQLIKIVAFYCEDGQQNKAKKLLKSFLTENPENETAKTYLAAIEKKATEAASYFEKGKAAYKRGHFITTRTQMNHALKKKPDYTDAKYYLHLAEGRSLLKKGGVNTLWEAIETFGKAMILKPDEAEPHFRMARAYEKKNEHEFVNAIDSYRQALKLNPDGPFSSANQQTHRKEKLDRFWGH